ncbi:hypothetical protein OPQ81_004907 [Rhizoctonia solani]|nr:hypothetical protein OPQ81_004907 [Rhizoctonia solani]
MIRLRTNSITSLFRLLHLRNEISAPHLDITDVCPDPTAIRAYYTATMALARGSRTRPGLPFELIIYICRLADFEILQIKRSPEGIREVRAWGPKVESRLWFQTEPFTKQMVSRIKSIQLVTMSHHQGFVDDRQAGSWSWFERRPNGDEVSQLSHTHPVEEETAEQQNDFAEYRGRLFGPGDQMWRDIEEGDVLQVMMKAQFPEWINVACDGVLRVHMWWEPSSEMLELIYCDTRPQ